MSAIDEDSIVKNDIKKKKSLALEARELKEIVSPKTIDEISFKEEMDERVNGQKL